MSAEFKLDGMDEIRAALRTLPEQMTREEWGPIVTDAAGGMVGDLKAVYPRVSGALAGGVVVEHVSPLVAKVKSTAPHAHLYEYGTIARFTKDTGAARGAMPAKNVFAPAAIRWRERMVQRTKDSLRRMRIPGFTGTPEVRES